MSTLDPTPAPAGGGSSGRRVLEVRALCKTFTLHTVDGRTVVSLTGVDLDVDAGEHVALVGPSGAGKSSLLRRVHRTYLPDAGTVTLHGEDGPVRLTGLADRAMARLRGRELGYVAQFLSAPPRTGPLEVVAAAARRRGLDRDAARDAAAAALRRLGLDEVLWDVDCGVLSGGERQRVNLAAGTVSPPRLLLLDEPVSALDPANRERALELVASLAGRGVAVLAVFHDAQAVARPPRDFVLGHVRAVLPDRVLDHARIVVRDGRIAEVGQHPAGSGADLDGRGLLCLPGLVDVHSDGLERERLPRPGAEVPWRFALLSFEQTLRAAGITTVFHGAGFEEGASPTKTRSVALAAELCAAVARRGTGPVDHRILHRLDVRCADGLAALRARLPERAVVSHEDHTPGQGQYTDRGYYERFLAGTRGLTDAQARAEVDAIVVDRDRRVRVRDEALHWLGGLARSGRVHLFGHDPASAAEIDDLVARGGTVAEFPTTVAAATAARERGMTVVMGAPNALRGGSHAGNASVRDLALRGLVTALASDYLPSGLLAAAFGLAADRVLGLPAAVGLVTAGAADAAGLVDRGALVPGLRADLVLVEPVQPWPLVRATVRAESPR